jgi:FkbM family methyltransferase
MKVRRDVSPADVAPLTAPHAAPARLIMEVIKRSPLISPLLFRAYNHILRRRHQEYSARAYFGATFRCDLDDMISRMIFYFGVWEPNNSALVDSLLKPGDVFVDVGANIGYYTLLASSRVGPSGKVVAIEASPAIFAQLRENISTNGADNTRLLNAAASDSRQELHVYGGTRWNRGATSTVVHSPDQMPEATVAAAPIDELLLPDELRRVVLIKIDIEGGELPVLERILAMLDRYPKDVKLLVELAPQVAGDRLRAAFDGLRAAGFEAFAIENQYDAHWYLDWRKPCALQRIDSLPAHQTDVLMVRAPVYDFLAKWTQNRATWPRRRSDPARTDAAAAVL